MNNHYLRKKLADFQDCIFWTSVFTYQKYLLCIYDLFSDAKHQSKGKMTTMADLDARSASSVLSANAAFVQGLVNAKKPEPQLLPPVEAEEIFSAQQVVSKFPSSEARLQLPPPALVIPMLLPLLTLPVPETEVLLLEPL